MGEDIIEEEEEEEVVGWGKVMKMSMHIEVGRRG